MPGPSVVELIAQINLAVESLEVRFRVGEVVPGDIEDLKGTVDDARLRLWALLKASADDPEFEERFRIRRMAELCTRLAAGLDAELIGPRNKGFKELVSANAKLSKSLEKASRRKE